MMALGGSDDDDKQDLLSSVSLLIDPSLRNCANRNLKPHQYDKSEQEVRSSRRTRILWMTLCIGLE